jgi:hypothetical protein
LALDSGVRKKPSDERGPKAIAAIRQPQPITISGDRHVPGFDTPDAATPLDNSLAIGSPGK